EPSVVVCFEEVEEIEELQIERTCLEKEKGKLVYVIDGEESEILDVSHYIGMHEIVDSTDAWVRAYYEPLKT
ncbi:hypothetical protein KI387_017192, partial [Taxus chinensis]